jgi:hypothetical protein
VGRDPDVKRRRVYAMKVFGMPDHLQRLQDIWGLLVPQALRGVENARPDYYYNNPGELVVYRRNWLEGFGDEIGARIRKAENAAAAAAGALVLYKSDRERADVAMRDEHPNLKSIASSRRFDGGGYEQGRQDGKTAQLHKSLT